MNTTDRADRMPQETVRRIQQGLTTGNHSLTLSHQPGEWDGTFHAALTALLTDALSDGPVPGRIETDDGQTIDGTIVSFNGSFITVESLDLSLRVDFEDVASIRI